MMTPGKRKRYVAGHGSREEESDRISFLKIMFDNCVSQRKRRRDAGGGNLMNLKLNGLNAKEEEKSIYSQTGAANANGNKNNSDQLLDYSDINGRTMLSSAELEDDKHHLPLSVEDFQARLASFDILHWNRVPDSICGFHCARFGWKLYCGNETDGLVCVTCKSFVPVPSTRLSLRGKEWGQQLRAAIESTHHLSTCPWRISFTPVTILSLPKSFEMLWWVRESFSALNTALSLSLKLAPPYDSIKKQVGLQWLADIVGIKREELHGLTDLQKDSLFLVMNGWSALAMHSGNIISCRYCLRNVPLWVKAPVLSRKGTKEGSSDEGAANTGIEAITRDSTLLDPVNNHYWWCPWRRFLEFATAADVSNNIDLIYYESIFERRFEDSAFLKNHASADDYTRMKSYIEEECAQPLSLSGTNVTLQPKLVHSVSELLDGCLSIAWLFDRSPDESISMHDRELTSVSDEQTKSRVEECESDRQNQSFESSAVSIEDIHVPNSNEVHVHTCVDYYIDPSIQSVAFPAITGHSSEHNFRTTDLKSEILKKEAGFPTIVLIDKAPVSAVPEKIAISQIDTPLNSKHLAVTEANDQIEYSFIATPAPVQDCPDDHGSSDDSQQFEDGVRSSCVDGEEDHTACDQSSVEYAASSCVIDSEDSNHHLLPASLSCNNSIESLTETVSKKPSVENLPLLTFIQEDGTSVICLSSTPRKIYPEDAAEHKQCMKVNSTALFSVMDADKKQLVPSLSLPHQNIDDEIQEDQTAESIETVTSELVRVLVDVIEKNSHATNLPISEPQDEACELPCAIVGETVRVFRRSASEPPRCQNRVRKRKFSENDRTGNKVSIHKTTTTDLLE